MADDTASELRRLPSNLDAERAVLGSILLDNTVLPTVMRHLDIAHFYDAGHREVFTAIGELEERGVSIDPTTLSDALARAGKLEHAGGPAYILRLESYVLSTANVEAHARIVRDKALKRRLIAATHEIADRTYREEDDAEELLSRATQEVFAIQRDQIGEAVRPMSETTQEVIDQIEEGRSHRRAYTGLPSGYADLDYMTSGFQNSDLIILAGRTSMGKTAFALNVATRVVLQQRVPTLFFSLEMSRHQLVQRILAVVSGVGLGDIRSSGRLQDQDFVHLIEAGKPVGSSPLLVDDTPGIDIADIRSRARHHKSQTPDLGLIVVDYLQLVTDSHSKKGNSDSRQNEVARISGALKGVARELDVPLIALAQLSRAVEQRRGKDKTPILSDLRESGAIEQDADLVMFVHRPDFYATDEEKKEADEISRAQILVRKHRNGRTGEVDLFFHGPTTRFRAVERHG